MDAQTFYDAWESVDQASAGFTKDAVVKNSDNFGVRSDYSPSTVVKLIRKDETVNSCVLTKVDATVSSGWFLEASNQRSKNAVQNLFEENNFNALLRQILWNLYSFGNVFIEVVRNGNGTPEELHVLETTEMEIVDVDGHGEVDHYLQRSSAATAKKGGNIVRFDPEDVIHLRLDRLTTSLWGEIPIRPLDLYVGTKIEVKNHMWNLFHQNLFRNSFEYPMEANEDDVKASAAFLKEALKDTKKPLVTWGVQSKPFTTFEDGPRFIELINKIDMAILSQMQVPPIMAGIPDNSGRASGEQETYKAFNTHIRGVQQLIASTITHEMFGKLGYTGISFHFGELDKKSEKDVLEQLVQLKALGAKPDKLEEYAKAQGLDLPDDFFNPDFYESPSKQDNDAMTNQTAQSRRGQNDGEMNERVGTGSESETREDQIVTQAIDRLQLWGNPQLVERIKENARKIQ